MHDDEKDKLIQEIRNWINVDEEIKGLQKKIRSLKQEKKIMINHSFFM